MSVITFQGAISGLKAAAEGAIALGKLHTLAEVQAKAVELQQIILSAQSSALEAQSEQFALLEQIRNLEKELADVKAWESEKQKYELIDLFAGNDRAGAAFVYARKSGVEPAEPPHKICAHCYQEGKKSILQQETRVPGMDRVLLCNACGSEIYVAGVRHPQHAKPSRGR